MSSKSSIGKGIVAALISLVLVVIALETIPRLVPQLLPQKVQSVQRIYTARSSWENMMRGDSDLGFALRPNLDLSFPSEGRQIGIRTASFGADEIGFRDIGTDPPYDIVALGDSFTFCDDSPVETCWVKRLGELTDRSVATFGVNGYSNLAEARLLEKVGEELSPKIVIVGFFPNDFKDNLHFSNWSKSGTDDDYWTWMRRKRRSDTSDSLARHSFLYRLFDAARRYSKRDTFEYNENGLSFIFKADAWWRTVLQNPGATPGYHLTETAFKQMQESTQAIGAELVVLLFPFKEQAYWHIAQSFYRDRKWTEAEVDAPMRAVADFLTRQNIKFCDLTPDMRAGAREGKQLYLRVSAHWTDDGNAAAAQSVARCLTGLNLIADGGNKTASEVN